MRKLRSLCAAPLLGMCVGSIAAWPGVATASVVSWDIGSGDWDTVTGSWQGAPWVNGDDAVFGGTGGSKITIVESGISASSVIFEVTGNTLAGASGNGLTLTGAASVDVGAGLTATISAPLNAATGVTKLGDGTLTLTGTQNYTTLTASAGTTEVRGTFASNTGVVIAHAAVNFSGVSQTLASLQIGAGARVTFSSASAVSWTGAGGATWGGTGSNWLGNLAPTPVDTVLFDANSTANLSTTLDAGFAVAGLKVTTPAGAVSVGGTSTLALGSGGIDLGSAMQNLTVSAPVSFSTNQRWNVAANRVLTVGKSLASTGSLSKQGDGMLTITAAQAYDGATVINGGTLKLQGGPGSFRYYRFTPTAFKGAGNSVQFSELQFFLHDVWTAATTVTNPGGSNPGNEEPFRANDNNTGTKFLDFNYGGLVYDFGTGKVFDEYNWATANDATPRDPVRWKVEGSNNNSTWTMLDDRTAATQTVTDSRNTWVALGATRLSGWTLGVGNGANLLPITTAMSMAPNTTFDLNGADQQIGSLADLGAATGHRVLLGSGTLTVGDGNNTTFSGAISGTGGSVTKDSLGTLTLTGINTHTGTTTVKLGTLIVADDTALGATGPSGAVLKLSGGTLVPMASFTTSRPVNVAAGGSAVDTNGFDLTFTGAISGTVGLTKVGAGTLSLVGNSTFSGTTSVMAGKLVATVAGLAGPVILANNTDVTFDQNSTGTYSRAISGNGRLIKQGSGVLNLTSNHTYDGPTVVENGTLALLGVPPTGLSYVGTQFNMGSGWRTASVTKTFGLNPNNVLGNDGYWVMGANERISKPSYISSWSITAGAIYPGNGGYALIDNPTTTPGASPSTFVSGTTTGGGPDDLTFTLGGTVPGQIRVGVMIDGLDGDGFNPNTVKLQQVGGGGLISPIIDTSHNGTNSSGYNNRVPDWLFFDIKGFTAGSQFKLIATAGNNNTATLQAFAFDSFALGGGTNILPTTTRVTVASGATLDVGGVSVGSLAQTIGSLADELSGGGGTVMLRDGSTLTVGDDGTDSTFSGNITGAGTLVKIGAGVLTLAGAQDYRTLTINEGVTNVTGSFTDGTATINANAATHFWASQTLSALHIGAGAVVTFSSGAPSAALAGKAFQTTVPEPSSGLLLFGASGLLLGWKRRGRG
ncbi:MAG: autotransporter-associated beta strand repeat-containing protein [Chthoniobacter sp.]|nr:autotransporter-associated beta strand repeat-containing protein [Chthoniobacter sp.]